MDLDNALGAPKLATHQLPKALLGFRAPKKYETPSTIEQLTDRLEAAGAAMLGLQVRGLKPAGYGSNMPTPVQDPCESYGWTEEDMPVPMPDARAITAMDEALGWVQLIPLDTPRPGSGQRHSYHGGAILRRLVMARCFVDPRTGKHTFSWRRIGKLMHASPESCRQWHARGLDLVLAGLRRRG